MFNLFRKIKSQFKVNLRRIAFEGAGLTVLLSFIIILLLSNIFTVIENSNKNQFIFEEELKSLEENRRKNQELDERLEILSTDSQLLLILRDVMHMATPKEQLYRTKEEINFFEYEKKLLKVDSIDDYSSWWVSLIM